MTTASFVLEMDRTEPDYGRLVGFAARLENLLAKPKVQADDNLPDALDDFLGAVYALVLAKSLGFTDRPTGNQTERDKVQVRAKQVSTGRIRLDGKWMAGFHFNAYGVVYEIDGPITTPSGRTVRFCSIWQVDTGTDVPRFITMYPR